MPLQQQEPEMTEAIESWSFGLFAIYKPINVKLTTTLSKIRQHPCHRLDVVSGYFYRFPVPRSASLLSLKYAAILAKGGKHVLLLLLRLLLRLLLVASSFSSSSSSVPLSSSSSPRPLCFLFYFAPCLYLSVVHSAAGEQQGAIMD